MVMDQSKVVGVHMLLALRTMTQLAITGSDCNVLLYMIVSYQDFTFYINVQ